MGSSTEWLTDFQKHLKKVLPLNVDEFHDMIHFHDQKKIDIKFFTKEVIKSVKSYKKEYLSDFEKLEIAVHAVVKLVNEAADIVVKSVAGCCSQCPFCTEQLQCDRTDCFHDADHLCALHHS